MQFGQLAIAKSSFSWSLEKLTVGCAVGAKLTSGRLSDAGRKPVKFKFGAAGVVTLTLVNQS
jgi:hypothetical protein